MMEELYYKMIYLRTLLLQDQEQLSLTLMEKLTAAQRSATTEQLRVQTERVATLDTDFMYVQGLFTKEAAKEEYERMHKLFTEKTAVQRSVFNQQLLAQPNEGSELELPEYESIQELFIEEAAIQKSVISKQLPGKQMREQTWNYQSTKISLICPQKK